MIEAIGILTNIPIIPNILYPINKESKTVITEMFNISPITLGYITFANN